jgi:molybdate transport system regulatory protein
VKKPASANAMIVNGRPPLSAGQYVRSNIRTKVWLEHEGRFAIREGGLALLLALAASGSLAKAAQQIGWSYRHAWGYLRRAETVLDAQLTATRPGKGRSRGTELTNTGRRVIEQLIGVRRRVDDVLGPTGPTPSEIAVRGMPTGQRGFDGDVSTRRTGPETK